MALGLLPAREQNSVRRKLNAKKQLLEEERRKRIVEEAKKERRSTFLTPLAAERSDRDRI